MKDNSRTEHCQGSGTHGVLFQDHSSPRIAVGAPSFSAFFAERVGARDSYPDLNRFLVDRKPQSR